MGMDRNGIARLLLLTYEGIATTIQELSLDEADAYYKKELLDYYALKSAPSAASESPITRNIIHMLATGSALHEDPPLEKYFAAYLSTFTDTYQAKIASRVGTAQRSLSAYKKSRGNKGSKNSLLFNLEVRITLLATFIFSAEQKAERSEASGVEVTFPLSTINSANRTLQRQSMLRFSPEESLPSHELGSKLLHYERCKALGNLINTCSDEGLKNAYQKLRYEMTEQAIQNPLNKGGRHRKRQTSKASESSIEHLSPLLNYFLEFLSNFYRKPVTSYTVQLLLRQEKKRGEELGPSQSSLSPPQEQALELQPLYPSSGSVTPDFPSEIHSLAPSSLLQRILRAIRDGEKGREDIFTLRSEIKEAARIGIASPSIDTKRIQDAYLAVVAQYPEFEGPEQDVHTQSEFYGSRTRDINAAAAARAVTACSHTPLLHAQRNSSGQYRREADQQKKCFGRCVML